MLIIDYLLLMAANANIDKCQGQTAEAVPGCSGVNSH